ncbi:uncharacterized protein LOC112592834 [Melanaphis sacchari]|uniref:uncharacterized protein LOC112592834 n=1 Tax=Melanaphis sacchari TaxID=742174 RepID=UPI000DC1441D|nr:uncharacterized protein LOC112592834 [Melanaphis sacchari]
MSFKNIEYLISQKNKPLVKYDGFLYRKDCENGEVSYWRCAEVEKCRGRINIKNDLVIKDSSFKHVHVPNPAKIEVKQLTEEMKKSALTTQHNPSKIISDIVKTASSNVIQGSLTSVPNLKRIIQRTRQCNQHSPPNPLTLKDLGEIPDIYKQTNNGSKFLLFDNYEINGPTKNRILIFCTREGLELMSESEHWFADGTFKSAPSIFTQIYTIHVLIYNTVIPVVFALLPDKSTSTYSYLIKTLKSHIPLNPKTIMTDFEQSAILAFKEIFPNIISRGCHFHLSQCVWRKIQSIPTIHEKYITDAEFCIQIRLLPALAYVPVSDVIASFEHLCESDYYIEHEELFRPLLDYFEDTWLGKTVRKRRRGPTFPLEMWNCYDAIDLPKTNNSVEGWNRGFNHLLGSCHPTLWKLIEGFKQEQTNTEMKIEQYIRGQNPIKKKKKYQDTALRILEIQKQYTERNILNYLKGIAYNLSLQV